MTRDFDNGRRSTVVELLRTAAVRWTEIEGNRRVAAFAFYAIFSLFPLLLLAVTVVGFFLGDDAAARERLVSAIASPTSAAGELVASALQAMQAARNARGLSALVGVATLMFGASGAFVEFHTVLNRIWGIPDRAARGAFAWARLLLRERLVGFATVVAVGITLLASFIASSLLAAFAARAGTLHVPARVWELGGTILVLSLALTAAFHFSIRTHPPPRLLVGGAVGITLSLTLLKELFATAISHFTSYSAYGVAGAVLALATWIYLSSWVVFAGAQVTRVWSEHVASRRKGAAAARPAEAMSQPWRETRSPRA